MSNKEESIKELTTEVSNISEELVSQRDRVKGVEQMLATEKMRTEQARTDLAAVKDQLSDTKDRLGKALHATAEVQVTASSTPWLLLRDTWPAAYKCQQAHNTNGRNCHTGSGSHGELSAELETEVSTAQAKLQERNKELTDSVGRFELLQGSKDKLEAELHACIHQKRTAQLGWNEQKAALEAEVEVCGFGSTLGVCLTACEP